jgi:ABC-type uncharacterized transport system involved in gliding motility auxiliary subunit
MNKWAKASFFAAFLIFIAVMALQFETQLWLNLYSVLMVLAAGFVVVGLMFDYRMYYEFLTMRTTKHGLNMGAMILIVLVLLVCVNYLAALHNKSWDLTQEKLNSLSDESTSVMNNLKDDIEIKVFNKGPQAAEEKQKVKQTLNLYSDYSSHIKIHFVNPYVENDLAMQYLNELPDRETQNTFVFFERAGRKVRAEQPFDEAAITSAMIKITRTGESKIYFIKGHGEKDIDSDNEQGIKDFARSLGESSFKVESLSLIDKKEIPKDAAAIAIVGPSTSYLEEELKWLHDYAQNGGRLFIALDPGQHTNMNALVKSLGVEFENNYVVTISPLVNAGPAAILGRIFDHASEITRNFTEGASFALFYIVSELKIASDKNSTIQVKELVKTDGSSFTMTDLRQKLTAQPQTKSVMIGAESKGKIEESAPKEFLAVIFGDSDFLSNRSLMVGVNRDLGLNAFASLSDQKDLLSIRPKLPKGTMLILTGFQRLTVVILSLALPILLLVTSGVVWFRRRGA